MQGPSAPHTPQQHQQSSYYQAPAQGKQCQPALSTNRFQHRSSGQNHPSNRHTHNSKANKCHHKAYPLHYMQCRRARGYTQCACSAQLQLLGAAALYRNIVTSANDAPSKSHTRCGSALSNSLRPSENVLLPLTKQGSRTCPGTMQKASQRQRS